MSRSPGIIRMEAAWGPRAVVGWPILDGVAARVPGWAHVGWMRHFGQGERMPVYLPVPYTRARCFPIIYTHQILAGEIDYA